jgi:hypothetical protein
MGQGWEEIAADKRARLAKTIPAEWKVQDLPAEDSVFDFPKASGLLSAEELEITGSSATDLVAKLAKGELKSVDVTRAFCKRAALAQQVVRFGIGSGASLRTDCGPRQIVCMSSSLKQPLHKPKSSIFTSRRTMALLVRCMASLSLSRTSSE